MLCDSILKGTQQEDSFFLNSLFTKGDNVIVLNLFKDYDFCLIWLLKRMKLTFFFSCFLN